MAKHQRRPGESIAAERRRTKLPKQASATAKKRALGARGKAKRKTR